MSKRPRLTDKHVDLVHRHVENSGSLPGLVPITEEEYDDHLRAFLQDRPDGPIGVFAYGSLIWRPVFEPAEIRRATALGWERAFTLLLKRFRGTPEIPGLMMQLDHGDACDGVLQMVSEGREWDILSDMWRREMTVWPSGNIPSWIDVESNGKTIRAIAFTANPESPNYTGRLTLDEVAAVLSEACGHWGSGAEYLLRTIEALEDHGIHDSHLWTLQDRVASLIEDRFDFRPTRRS